MSRTSYGGALWLALCVCLALLSSAVYVGGSGPHTMSDRTTIKINYTPATTPHTPPPRSQRTPPPPVLFRQPNEAVPPPFLQTPVEESLLVEEASETAPSDDGFIGTVPGGANGAGSVDSSDSSDPFEPRWSEAASAWTELDGHCWTHTTTTYVYSFCPFQNVTQKSTSMNLNVVLGVFDSWVDATLPTVADEATLADGSGSPVSEASTGTTATPAASPAPTGLTMLFTDGNACASGKRRSTRVQFVCISEAPPVPSLPRGIAANGARIGDVTEPDTCEYTLNFYMPLMCDMITVDNNDNSNAGTASDAADRAILAGMQACIDALVRHSTDAVASDPLSDDVLRVCDAYMPEPLTDDAAVVDAANELRDPEPPVDARTPINEVPHESLLTSDEPIPLEARSTPYDQSQDGYREREA